MLDLLDMDHTTRAGEPALDCVNHATCRVRRRSSRPCPLLLTGALLVAGVAASAAETRRVRLRVEEAGEPLPCRMHLADGQGDPIAAPGLPFFRDHFVLPGAAELELAPGTYALLVERGPEYDRLVTTLRVEPAGPQDEGAQEEVYALVRRTDMSAQGWWSGETHVHRDPRDVELLMQAEDLHVAPVLTEWNARNYWDEHPLPAELLVRFDGDRFYHLLSAEDERQGGALLFHGLERPIALGAQGREFPSPLTNAQAARSAGARWLEIEKPFWWDAPTWLASGEVDLVGLANNHMCHRRMYEDEAWGRPRDAQRLPPPRGNGFYSQELYYRILDCGFRIPPVAGSASGVLPNPVGYNRVYVYVPGELTYASWWRGLLAGRSFVTNGPLLLVRAAGRLPGEVFHAPAGVPFRVSIRVEVDSADPLERVEVIRNGEVVLRRDLRGAKRFAGNLDVELEATGWFLVRAIADVAETFRFASTAPFHVELGDSGPRIDPDDVRFFVEWIDARMAQIDSGAHQELAGEELRAVLAPHRAAHEYFKRLLARAGSDPRS